MYNPTIIQRNPRQSEDPPMSKHLTTVGRKNPLKVRDPQQNQAQRRAANCHDWFGVRGGQVTNLVLRQQLNLFIVIYVSFYRDHSKKLLVLGSKYRTYQINRSAFITAYRDKCRSNAPMFQCQTAMQFSTKKG